MVYNDKFDLKILDHTCILVALLLQEVERLIQLALARYSADRIAKFDFALENAGGSVVAERSSPTYSLALADVRLFGWKMWTVSTSCPSMIIQVEPQLWAGYWCDRKVLYTYNMCSSRWGDSGSVW